MCCVITLTSSLTSCTAQLSQLQALPQSSTPAFEFKSTDGAINGSNLPRGCDGSSRGLRARYGRPG